MTDKKLFILMIFMFLCSVLVHGRDGQKMRLKYNQKKSVSFNEKQFLKNIKQDCKTYGYKRGWEEISPDEVLQTYPKELAFLYLKKHMNTLCYYSVSRLIKYLHQDFKTQTEKLITSVVRNCLDLKKKDVICQDINKQSTLYDLTVLLGSYCTIKTLSSFKKVNCHYKTIAEKSCSIYKNQNKPLHNCPQFFSNKVEVKDLHKSYFGKHCKKLKWRNPRCLN